jgi:hypothetical protein
MGALCTSPAQNAQQAATATATADNAEIGQEEGYVNNSEANLRGAIAGLGPDPYFQPPAPPPPVNPANATNFTAAAPQAQPTPQAAGITQNPFTPAQRNPFAPRQARPVARAQAQ